MSQIREEFPSPKEGSSCAGSSLPSRAGQGDREGNEIADRIYNTRDFDNNLVIDDRTKLVAASSMFPSNIAEPRVCDQQIDIGWGAAVPFSPARAEIASAIGSSPSRQSVCSASLPSNR
jgi:hypothetical protein